MKKTVSEYIVDYLIDKGVEYIIGIPGHGCLSFFDAIRDRAQKGAIKYIQVKKEMSAVHLADGYYRACGKPLAVFTSIGPGALNTIIGMGTAFVDSTPVLLFMGDAHTHMRGTGILQEIERQHDSDILSCFRPVTKRCWRIESPNQVHRIIKRAFTYMSEGRSGPVAIAMPMDIQAKYIDTHQEIAEEISAPILGLCAEDERIKEAVALIKSAKRPVIVAGGGALYAGASKELVAFAERSGSAVVTTMAGKSAFPEDHPLYGWHGGSKGTDLGNYLCRNADVILALGCRFADESTSSYRKNITYNFPETKLIHVDIDPAEMGKNYPCTIKIAADLKSVLRRLLEHFPKEPPISEDFKLYLGDIAQKKAEWFDKLKAQRESAGGLLTISKFLHEFNHLYPQNGIVVTSSGNTQAQVLQEYCFKQPNTHITTGGFSTMGFSLPAAIGAKLAKPELPVASLIGDGDFMMCMQELSTIKQLGLNILTVVLNNNGWMAIRDLQSDVFGGEYAYGNHFTTPDGLTYTPDFCAVAEAFGIRSVKVSHEEQLSEAITKALNASASEPIFMEVSVTDVYPYSGGAAAGWWDVPIPAYMKEKEAQYLEGVKEEYIL